MQISRMIILMTMTAAVLVASSLAYAASLDVPSNGDTLSGIGIIHGWKCEAEGAITIRFDAGSPIPATYGFPRGDTSPTCGGDDGDNGFYAFFNWAILGDGEHTAVAYDDGVPFAQATFTVVTTGEEFLSGVEAQCTIPDFPAPGEEARFVWNESTQHLELATVSDLSEPVARGKLYWTGWSISRYTIQRANLDGSQVETLVSSGFYDRVKSLAVDPTGDKLYWVIDDGYGERSAIQRANLDGSQQEILVALWDEQSIKSLAVDPTRGKLYWTVSDYESGRDAIQRANLDGSQVETLLSGPPYGSLAVDPIRGKLYWTGRSISRYTIQRANLDGSQVETLLTNSEQKRSLAVDFAGGKLYWVADDGGGDTDPIRRANLDGSQRETILTSGSYERVTSLAVDPTRGRLYWAVQRSTASGNTDTIQRANLDGSQVEILVRPGDDGFYSQGILALALE